MLWRTRVIWNLDVFGSCKKLVKSYINHSILRPCHNHRLYKNMEKVYMRQQPNCEHLYINFHYENPQLHIDKEFNFIRNVNEKVEIALSRIKLNIEKELKKRAKKSKKKNASQTNETTESNLVNNEIPVDFIYGDDDKKTIISDHSTFREMLEHIKDNLQMRLFGQTFDVVLNEPWVVKFSLPSSILAGFMVYPNKIELQFAELTYCKGLWFKAQKPKSGDLEKGANWEVCGHGLIYHSKNDDIGYHLKFLLKPGNANNDYGPGVENITKQAVEAGPGTCPFETRHKFTESYLSGNSIRVMSYNILADLYADSELSRTNLFPYCPAYALKIDYRKQLLMKEIIGYNVDIMCFQEVDIRIFRSDLKLVLKYFDLNYQGHIAEKSHSGEGVAIFYRKDRFDLISTHAINIGENVSTLQEFCEIWKRISNNKKLVARLCDLATTLQIIRLKHKESGQILIVCNTHLYFHPDADHIRLLQIGFCMHYIDSFYQKTIEELKVEDESKIAIIFCGDFNSVPECGIYKLMTEGFVGDDFIDWRSNAQQTVKNVTLTQPFKMQSACGTPKYTNYTHAFAACLDYIFIQKNRFEIEQVLPFPSEKELQTHVAIPSVVFPSDHISLVADLKLKINCAVK